jgi:hypothetical protein
MKITVLWVVTFRSLVEVYGCFRGACCFHLQADRPDEQDKLKGRGAGREKKRRRRQEESRVFSFVIKPSLYNISTSACLLFVTWVPED